MPLCVALINEDYLDTGSEQLKVFIGQLAITLVVQDPGSGSRYLHPTLSQDGLLSTKPQPWFTHFK